MSQLEFHRASQIIVLIHSDGTNLGQFDAANNVDSHSRGPWPDGTYTFVTEYPPPQGANDTPDSEYGDGPRFLFDVPGRDGMEVHAGRASVPDGLGRIGFRHCTMGCIRTTRAAIQAIDQMHKGDPLTEIVVA